jgi:hypothetical protein
MTDRTKERIRLVVTSAKRNNKSTTTSSNFVYQINRTVTRIKEVFINSINIPFTFYVINSSNNVLVFENGLFSITIPPGNYNSTSLGATLQSLLAASGNPFTVTFSLTTYKLTITSSAQVFNVVSITDDPTSTAAPLLGFNVTAPLALSVTADSVMNISGPNYIQIKSNFFTNPSHHKIVYADNTYQNTFVLIPITTGPGNALFVSPTLPIRFNYKLTISPNDLIDFQLTDEDGVEINLNGQEWYMEMICITE